MSRLITISRKPIVGWWVCAGEDSYAIMLDSDDISGYYVSGNLQHKLQT